MADVAQAAGVSQQTVSRVANGAQNVSKATREKVQAGRGSLPVIGCRAREELGQSSRNTS